MENKSEFNAVLYKTLLLFFPNDLVNLIYGYGKCHEDFVKTIKCKRNGKWINIDKITIIENVLYAFEGKNNIYAYNTNTTGLLYRRDYLDGVTNIINRHLLFDDKNCSGFNPNNNKILENFWHIDDSKNITTASDKYVFKYNHDTHKIKVYDKLKKYICDIKDEDEYEHKHKNYKFCYTKKNIIVNNNVLYIIGLISYIYDRDNGRTIREYYIHLYDAITFKFIREFGTSTIRHHDDYTEYHGPICMAFMDNKIFVCRNDYEIEIWNGYS
jgi:hypothetical protein